MALPIPNNELVLISGINGFIASRTAKSFLDAGYSVRGTVRVRNSAEALIRELQSYAEAGRLEIVEVADITQPGAFDKAVQDVHVIAHLAQPVQFANADPEYVIGTAVNGTTSILVSALEFGSTTLRSFLYMSSFAAVYNFYEPSYIYTEKDWNTKTAGEVARLGAAAGGLCIYRTSKASAEKAFWEFREKRKPGFTMTAINPVFVQGPPVAPPADPANLNDTTKPIWDIFSGGPIGPPWPAGTVDVRDVAEIIVQAAQKSIEADGQRYIVASGAGIPQAAADVLRAHIPAKRNIIQVGETGKGYAPGYTAAEGVVNVDTSKANKLLGRHWIQYDQTVLDTVKVLESRYG